MMVGVEFAMLFPEGWKVWSEGSPKFGIQSRLSPPTLRLPGAHGWDSALQPDEHARINLSGERTKRTVLESAMVGGIFRFSVRADIREASSEAPAYFSHYAYLQLEVVPAQHLSASGNLRCAYAMRSFPTETSPIHPPSRLLLKSLEASCPYRQEIH